MKQFIVDSRISIKTKTMKKPIDLVAVVKFAEENESSSTISSVLIGGRWYRSPGLGLDDYYYHFKEGGVGHIEAYYDHNWEYDRMFTWSVEEKTLIITDPATLKNVYPSIVRYEVHFENDNFFWMKSLYINSEKIYLARS